ncbi:MAG: hypothetical protein Q9177_000651 [Variospora cf. flavescens]
MLLRKAAALVLAASAAIACVIYEYTIKARTNGGNFRIPIYQRDVDFQWGTTKVRGVNIGGWLLLEPWITPSIFQALDGSVVDEYTLCEKVGNASDILKQHWDSFVSLRDFQKIKNAGFNTVRIPIGYWAYKKYNNDPYIQGAAPYMDKAIDWARQTGLKVWIDLHGAPLSQNGFDNSGQLIKKPDIPGWTQGDSIEATLAVIQLIANKYAQQSYQDVVVAIELLNEPLAESLTGGTNAVIQYYNDGYGNEHRQFVCTNSATYQDTNHWTVVAEWSAAMTDCAAGLNGWQVGARYDGWYPDSNRIGSCDNINYIDTWSDQFKNDTQLYIAAQISVFEQKTEGWVFWNFKTEASPEWDLFRLLDNKIFPQPLDSLSSKSGICSV